MQFHSWDLSKTQCYLYMESCGEVREQIAFALDLRSSFSMYTACTYWTWGRIQPLEGESVEIVDLSNCFQLWLYGIEADGSEYRRVKYFRGVEVWRVWI